MTAPVPAAAGGGEETVRDPIRGGRFPLLLVLLAALVPVTGCRVPVAKQRLLARPAMQFNGPAAHGFHSRVTPQIETGAAVAGGAQASGCSSCR